MLHPYSSGTELSRTEAVSSPSRASRFLVASLSAGFYRCVWNSEVLTIKKKTSRSSRKLISRRTRKTKRSPHTSLFPTDEEFVALCAEQNLSVRETDISVRSLSHSSVFTSIVESPPGDTVYCTQQSSRIMVSKTKSHECQHG